MLIHWPRCIALARTAAFGTKAAKINEKQPHTPIDHVLCLHASLLQVQTTLGIHQETGHSKDSIGAPQRLPVAALWRPESLSQAIGQMIFTLIQGPVGTFHANRREGQRLWSMGPEEGGHIHEAEDMGVAVIPGTATIAI